MIRTLQSILLLASMTWTSAGLASQELPLSVNCININEDLTRVAQLKESGQLRSESNKFPVEAFDFMSDRPFADYLSYAREWILAKNPKGEMLCPLESKISPLTQANLELDLQQVVDLVAPFELKVPGSEQVVLLIHGLTDSPFLFHDLAYEFYQQGLNVRTLLLPGHGTAPSALVDTTEKQWRQAAGYAMRQALSDYKQVYLGGFSTGGALILDQLSHGKWSPSQLDKIKGLLLWAPASKAKSDFAWAAKYLDFVPFVDWLNKGADIDFAKYESFPLNAAAQVDKLMGRINGKDKSLTKIPDIPMLVVTSEVDQTIDTTTTLRLVNQWHTAPSRKSLGSDNLIYYGDPKALKPLPDTLQVSIPSCQTQQLCDKVIDIAHNAATNSPKNPHYGHQGNYKYCEHHVDAEAFSACKTMPVAPTGEITAKNLERYGVLRRLTYNPYFEHMMTNIRDFLSR